ncbi:hypothetical protein B0H34DRAFT_782439 [Crassisporium funariophilum]|nr:hypothetical protein B0H34DRAFT_782439 [Crassisporium funariophilum]
MAIRSDSEELTRGASKSGAKADAVEDDAESGEDDENASEYEIEEVLDAKKGYFPDGRMGYYVRWKGYGEADNSWVDELDAGNATALVEEFWRKNPNRKRVPRKSTEKKSPKKPRKSVALDDSSDVGSTTKKRGRKSVSQKVDSEDEMDVDDTEKRAPKKAKKSSTHASKAAKKNTESPDMEEKVIQTMERYMGVGNWENLVKSVDTVERVNDKLMVYFTLHTGESVKEKSETCKERFPRKMIDFYEDNLRWRTVDEVAKDSP